MTKTANFIAEFMAIFLLNKHPHANIPALKENVYRLIDMTAQKSSGQKEEFRAKKHVSWEDDLDGTIMAIVVETVMLVLSGKLDEVSDDGKELQD